MSQRKILDDINQEYVVDYRKVYPKGDQMALMRKLKAIADEFERTDADNSGDIDLNEVSAAMARLGKPVNSAELKAALRRVDDDDSGTLRYREFINLILLEQGEIKAPIEEVKTSVRVKRGVRKGAVKKKKRGHLKLKVDLTKSKDVLILSCEAIRAAELLPADLSGFADPYVKMYVKPDPKKATKQKTKVIKQSLTPVWNEKFTWKFPVTTTLEKRYLSIEIWDRDRFNRNDFMGALAFELQELLDPDTIKSGWFILLDQEQGSVFNFPSKVTPKEGAASAPRKAVQQPAALHTAPKAGLRAEDFKFVKVLGRGSFGKVFLAERKTDNKMLAVKALKKVRVVEDDDVEATITEKKILALGASAPFMIQLVGAFQSESHLFFVMELVSGGDLMFHAMKNGAFSEKASAFYAAEISAGLQYLHDRGILYRDLKLDNVMLDSEGHVRLADFGLCKLGVKGADGRTQTFCGTPNYLAPEIVTYRAYGKAVDWWALGVVLYEMMNGTVLFDGETEKELFRSILHQKLDLPRQMSKAAMEIVGRFLDRSPRTRLGAGPDAKNEIRSMAFFSGINWDKLDARKEQPPFVPRVKGDKDTSNFDPEFTDERPNLTPEDPSALKTVDQDLFKGFTFEYQGQAEGLLV